MGGRDLPDGALDLGQFAGSRLGVGFAEPNGHGSYPQFLARRGASIRMGDQFCCSQVRAFYRVYGARHPGNARLDFEGRRTFDVLLPTAVFLLLIPSIDETIQLFVPGRAGMITDVMIDCCGAATGVVLRYLLRSLMCAKKAA